MSEPGDNTIDEPPPTLTWDDESQPGTSPAAGSSQGGQTRPPPDKKDSADETTHRLPQDPRIGQVIEGKYEIRKPLGAGGMATVYRAWHKLLQREVALKFIRPGDQNTAQFRERFFREARVATQLVHKNAVQTREFGETAAGEFYILMDYAPGKPLNEVIRKSGPLPLAQAIDITIQLLDALGEAHAMSIVHRDVKPANVMLDDKGLVKILDFGLAKVIMSEPEPTGDGTDVDQSAPTEQWQSDVTQGRSVLGTPRYMSPEQALGEACDGRSDLYSVGIVLFELLTGKIPYDGNSSMALVRAHIVEAPKRLKDRAPGGDFPEVLQGVLDKALEKQPGERFQTAEDFQSALLRLVEGGAIPLDESVEGQRRTSPTGRLARRTSRSALGALEALGKTVVDPVGEAPTELGQSGTDVSTSGWTQAGGAPPGSSSQVPLHPPASGGINPALLLGLVAVVLGAVALGVTVSGQLTGNPPTEPDPSPAPSSLVAVTPQPSRPPSPPPASPSPTVEATPTPSVRGLTPIEQLEENRDQVLALYQQAEGLIEMAIDIDANALASLELGKARLALIKAATQRTTTDRAIEAAREDPLQLVSAREALASERKRWEDVIDEGEELLTTIRRNRGDSLAERVALLTALRSRRATLEDSRQRLAEVAGSLSVEQRGRLAEFEGAAEGLPSDRDLASQPLTVLEGAWRDFYELQAGLTALAKDAGVPLPEP